MVLSEWRDELGSRRCQMLMVFNLQQDGCYGVPDRYAGEASVAVPHLGDLVVDLCAVFISNYSSVAFFLTPRETVHVRTLPAGCTPFR